MKAYQVVVTENYTPSFRGEKTKVYRTFTDKQRAYDCIKNITLKDIFENPELPWPEDQIKITYDFYLFGRDIYFKVANYNIIFRCHCEIEEIEIE